MDNYLTTIYYERFKITERERKLMANNQWPDDESGRISNVRNDQSISETREQLKVIDYIIKQYIEKIKRD
jgi:hypothetical protein